MSWKLQWGIMGTGNIARQFCVGVSASRRGQLRAVGSRTEQTAGTFAETHCVPTAHGSYEALLADRSIQAIYISLPNTMHHEWTIKALRAGKHVLCEKPFATSTADAEEMFDVAQKTGRLLVEAFMYRSHPLTKAYTAAIDSGAIGQVKLIRASFCYRTAKVVGNVRFSTELAGGGLMDVGCYCISFARMIARAEPTAVSVIAHRHESGVDDVAAGTLLFPGNVLATFTCGMSVQADNTASICGDEGYLEIPVPWKPPAIGAQYTIARATPPRQDQTGLNAVKSQPNAGPRQTFQIAAGGDLYGIEADDFAAAVLDGTSPAVTRQDSIGNMVVLEAMLRQLQRLS